MTHDSPSETRPIARPGQCLCGPEAALFFEVSVVAMDIDIYPMFACGFSRALNGADSGPDDGDQPLAMTLGRVALLSLSDKQDHQEIS